MMDFFRSRSSSPAPVSEQPKGRTFAQMLIASVAGSQYGNLVVYGVVSILESGGARIVKNGEAYSKTRGRMQDAYRVEFSDGSALDVRMP